MYNILRIPTSYRDLYDNAIDEFLHSVREQITSNNQVVVFDGVGQPIPIEFVRDHLNKFCSSVANPVVFCTGLHTRAQPAGEMKFVWSNHLYFEHQSVAAWTERFAITDQPRSRKFLSMGTKDYPERRFLVSNIITNGLLDQGYVSYSQEMISTELGLGYDQQQRDHVIATGKLIEHLLPIPSLDDSTEWTCMPRTFLTDSYVNMVNDTFYNQTNGGNTFLSEKVFNAIAHGQMFFMLSPRGTLQYLRDEGYQTFGDYVDESYDSLEENYDRLVAVTNSFIQFMQQPIEQIHKIYVDCLPIIQHNQQRLYNNTYVKDFEACVERAINEKI